MGTDLIPQPELNPWELVRDEEIDLGDGDEKSMRLELKRLTPGAPAYIELTIRRQQSLYIGMMSNADVPLSRREQALLLKTLLQIMRDNECKTLGAITSNPSTAQVLSYIANQGSASAVKSGEGPLVTLTQLEKAAIRMARWL